MNEDTEEITLDQTYLSARGKAYMPEQMAEFARMIFRLNRQISIVTFRDALGHKTEAFRNDFDRVTVQGKTY